MLSYELNIYNPYSQDAILQQFMTFSITNTFVSRDYIFKDYGKLQINVTGNGPSFFIRVDWVLLTSQTSNYTLQFEPNKIYSIAFGWGQGTAWTATYTLSRTIPFNHANLIYA